MSDVSDRLLKIASVIDSLLEKLAEEEKVAAKQEQIKEAELTNGFGTLSDVTDKANNPFLNFLFS